MIRFVFAFGFALALASCGFPRLASLTDGGNHGDDGGGDDGMCADVQVTTTRIPPSIELLLDRTGSMGQTDVPPTRYQALQTAVTNTLIQANGTALFGAVMFAGDEMPCPPDASVFGAFSVPRPSDQAAITNLIAVHSPAGNTPTAGWITVVAADFVAHPPPPLSPPIILLVTDGQPNSCSGAPDMGETVAATTMAFNQGIRTFTVGIAPAAADMAFLQQMAQAGTGDPTAVFATNTSQQLQAALTTIITRVQSCVLPIDKTIDSTKASSGHVTLDGNPLVFGTDWKLDATGGSLQLLATACTTFQMNINAKVDATFPCDAVGP